MDQWGADVLAIARNPDQSVASMQKRGHQRLSLNEARQRWAAALCTIGRVKEKWSERTHVVTFTDLVTRTEPTLVEICEFIGVGYMSHMLDGYTDTPQYSEQRIDASKANCDVPGCRMETHDAEALRFYESFL